MNDETHGLNKLLTIQQTAKLFQVNPRTIRNWIDDGKLKRFKVGHTVRISQEEIDRLKEV